MPVSSRDRVVGAVVVLIVLAPQTRWMGPAIIFSAAVWSWPLVRGWQLAGGAMEPRCFSLSARHRGTEPAFYRRIPNRYLTGFQHQFPRLFGDDWSDARIVTFNMLWLAASYWRRWVSTGEYHWLT
jgi:hypothetical protein